jgi:hypothetical protein
MNIQLRQSIFDPARHHLNVSSIPFASISKWLTEASYLSHLSAATHPAAGFWAFQIIDNELFIGWLIYSTGLVRIFRPALGRRDGDDPGCRYVVCRATSPENVPSAAISSL